jgi:hypothetical protein
MSGTTIEARVRPGTAIAAELAALRSQLEYSLELRVQEALGARCTQRPDSAARSSRHVSGSRSARIAARRSTRDATRRAVVSDRRTATEQIRAQDERIIAERARELVFTRMLERLPEGTVVRGMDRHAGTRRATIGLAGGGEVTLALDDRGRADLLMERCELAELDSPAGAVAGCEAEAELGRRFHECWRQAGVEVEADDEVDHGDGHLSMEAGS